MGWGDHNDSDVLYHVDDVMREAHEGESRLTTDPTVQGKSRPSYRLWWAAGVGEVARMNSHPDDDQVLQRAWFISGLKSPLKIGHRCAYNNLELTVKETNE